MTRLIFTLFSLKFVFFYRGMVYKGREQIERDGEMKEIETHDVKDT